MEEGGGGGRKAEKGDRVKGTGPREKAGGGKVADTAGGAGSDSAIILGSLDTLASVASRVTLSSYHALVRASLRRELECGTWRSYACWQCAGVSELGRPRYTYDVCPVLRPAATQVLESLQPLEAMKIDDVMQALKARVRDNSQKREETRLKLRETVEGMKRREEAAQRVVVVAPPLFGSEAALKEHLACAHNLQVGSTGDVLDCLRRCPAEVQPARPSERLLGVLLGVRSVAMRGGGRGAGPLRLRRCSGHSGAYAATRKGCGPLQSR